MMDRQTAEPGSIYRETAQKIAKLCQKWRTDGLVRLNAADMAEETTACIV